MRNTERPLPLSVVAAGGGEARWWFGQLALVKAGASETAGRYTLVEILAPPHYETPLHAHMREDEAFWILEGEATLDVGDQAIEAPRGTYLVAPRAVPHRLRAGPAGARVLFLFTPGGFEQLIEATSVPALEPTVPPQHVTPPEDVVEIARTFGTEIFGDDPPSEDATD
jgi:mannose-6-phosphate isomerase-like protein (cupin superfamily)